MFGGLLNWIMNTAQHHSAKPKLRFRTGSNPARGLLEIPDVANVLTMEMKLNAFRWPTIP